jgi:hypothetical protein
VERCFGVLQARFAIIKGPVHFWKKDDLHAIMATCILLHNMIIENEQEGLEFDASISITNHEPTPASSLDFVTLNDFIQ